MIPAGGPDPRAPGGHGWVYRMAEGQQAFSGRHPIQSGICVDATDIRPMTPVERLIFSALEGFMEVHPRMQAQIEDGAIALAASESRAADAEARAEGAERRAGELEADRARLDFLDCCNAALNAHYRTSYRWRLVLNHNVNRLILGHGDVDLHDSDGSNTALPSCREAIDEQMRERDAARALRREPRP